MIRIIGLAFCLLLMQDVTAQDKQIKYLSGKGSDDTVAWDFYCTGGRNSGYWTKIQVPSCWELQGFGTYNYGRDYKTYGRNFRFADEKGLYKHRFTLPAGWKGKQLFLVFEGSMTDTDVKLNGKSAGPVHRGSFYRFKYDITDKVKWNGENLLEAEVSKMSSESSVNNAERLADYWVFGGIFRPVWVEAVNPEHIEYVGIDARADGNFSMQVNSRGIVGNRTVLATIKDAAGRQVTTTSGTLLRGDTTVVLKAAVKNIKAWTSETPNLYTVEVELKNGSRVIYRHKEKFGFRTIEVRRGDGIYVNGVQVKMKGVNRHCFWPETGRTLNAAQELQDALLIKEMNMNAVRASHYPPDKRFLEICDSLGIYVINELAGWQKFYSTATGTPLVKEMILRDLNHPSIIFWANGNEGGTNKELDKEFYRWDFSQRPVIHPHHRPGNEFNGIDCNHYEDYYSTQKILNDSLIYMPTEFLHAQDDGGAASGMKDFWDLHWRSKRSGGGFLWAMVDEAVVRTDMNNGLDANGLNANDGILGPHREKEGSFFALREIFSPVRIEMEQWPENFNGLITLENRYHFTNLNENTYRWALVNYPPAFDILNTGYKIEKTGIASCPSIKPLDTGSLSLNLPANYKNYDALVLVATGRDGKEIYKWVYKLKDHKTLMAGNWGRENSKPTLEEKDSLLYFNSGGLQVTINKNTGMLAAARNTRLGNDKLSFANGPLLTTGTSAVQDVKMDNNESTPSAEFTLNGPLRRIKWTMQENGWLKLDYDYELNGSFPFAGVSFSYPENYIYHVKWLGKGPYRQWKNRTAGTPASVYKSLYNNTQTGYNPLVYPEFKGYYGDISWMEFNTLEGIFYVASEQPGLHVRLFDFYGLSGAPPFPKLPNGDISFLDAIPAMGTKLAFGISGNTSQLGPQSEPAKFSGTTSRTLYFYFGYPKVSDAVEQYSRPAVDNVF